MINSPSCFWWLGLAKVEKPLWLMRVKLYFPHSGKKPGNPGPPKNRPRGLPATKNTPWIMIKLWLIEGSERLHFYLFLFAVVCPWDFCICSRAPSICIVFYAILGTVIMINSGFIMINCLEIQGLILNNSIVIFFSLWLTCAKCSRWLTTAHDNSIYNI